MKMVFISRVQIFSDIIYRLVLMTLIYVIFKTHLSFNTTFSHRRDGLQTFQSYDA